MQINLGGLKNMYDIEEKKALLDKCMFSAIWLDGIDDDVMQELINQGIVKTMVDADGEIRYSVFINEQEYVFSSGYNELVSYFGTLQTTVENNGLGNLKCYSMEEYQRRLEQIKGLIADKGIHIDVRNPIVSKMEINRTFKIDGEMATYERVLDLLMALLPANTKLSVNSEWANKEKGNIDKNTFYATSKQTAKSKCYLGMKWYNKTKELKSHYRIILDENYIRLEFTLYGAKKIKRELGTNRFNEITDQAINEWFDTKVKNWITEPVEKWKKEQQKKVLQIMNECKKADGYKWVNKCITRLLNEEIRTRNGHKPLILDIEEVIPLVNELYENGDRRKKTKSAFRKIAKEDASNITNRDDLKLQELLEKLTAKETQVECNIGVLKNSTPKKVA